MNVLFLNGGAAVRNHDDAYLQFVDPASFLKRGGINLGDVLVFDATLKLLDFERISNIQFQEDWSGRDLAAIGADFDVCVIRGSNYISEKQDLGYLVPLIEGLGLPVIALGIGAQAATYRTLDLHKGTIRFLQAVSERCDSIGARGEYSAEVLADNGVDNVTVTGCPSLFRGRKPSITIDKQPYSQEMRIGLTLNKYLAGEYAEDQVKATRLQREFLVHAARHPNASLYSQGETDEFTLAVGLDDRRQAAVEAIMSKFGLDASATDVVEMLTQRTKVFFDIDSWALDASDVDLMIGFRLHGNVMALHQGRPAVFCTYDSRVRELAELFHVPFLDVADFRPIDIQRTHDAADFSGFERAYRHQYGVLRDFLERNGLRHRLVEDAGERPAPESSAAPMATPHTTTDIGDWYLPELTWMSKEIVRLQNRAWTLSQKLAELQTEAAGH